MANVTVVIDDTVLKRARMRALDQGTSVNALLRTYLEHFVGEPIERNAMTRLLDIADESTSGSGAAGRSWTRDELHDR